MSLLYVPITDYRGKIVGYVPPWFLGFGPGCGIVFVLSVFVLVVFGGSVTVRQMLVLEGWYFPLLGAMLFGLVGSGWYIYVMETLESYPIRPIWPSVLRLRS